MTDKSDESMSPQKGKSTDVNSPLKNKSDEIMSQLKGNTSFNINSHPKLKEETSSPDHLPIVSKRQSGKQVVRKVFLTFISLKLNLH